MKQFTGNESTFKGFNILTIDLYNIIYITKLIQGIFSTGRTLNLGHICYKFSFTGNPEDYDGQSRISERKRNVSKLKKNNPGQ